MSKSGLKRLTKRLALLTTSVCRSFSCFPSITTFCCSELAVDLHTLGSPGAMRHASRVMILSSANPLVSRAVVSTLMYMVDNSSPKLHNC